MRRSFLSNCAPGDVLDDVFVLANKQLSPTQNGKLFIKALLSDKTMQVPARMWNATKQLFDAIPEGFARIRGRCENYQNNLQIVIDQASVPAEGSFDPADLIPHTAKDIDEMCAKLHAKLGSIQNRYLSALVNSYLDDKGLMERLCKAPAAVSFHHAFLGGLLEHTLNVIEVADAVCPFYPGISRDLVIVGLFLHDIAKTWELNYDCAFSYADGGQLVGHIVKSALWLEHKRKATEKKLGEPIPDALIDVLQHIIISHHGAVDKGFGSAKTPMTPEAMMVSFIDDMDAKLMLALEATRGEAAQGEGVWTEYMKAFGGRLYRPDLAAPPAAEAEQRPAMRLVTGDEEPAADKQAVLNNPHFEVEPTPKR